MRAAAIVVGTVFLAGRADAADPPICTDRPAKANAVCTVPLGRFQVESSAVDWTILDQNGSRTETLAVGTTAIKYGLTDRSDLQIGFTPYIRLKNGDSATTLRGAGDAIVRYKNRLTPAQSPVQVAIIPFFKAPTAKRGIGNRKLEGGLSLPVSLPIVGATLTFGPEADILVDGDGRGRHLALVNVVNLSTAVAPRLTATGEVWSNLNFDSSGTIKQASADAALAYAVSNRWQLDVGVNAGLTSDTPDVEVYGGLSLRL